jgi:hypothetical protein
MTRKRRDYVKMVGLTCESLDDNLDKLDEKGVEFIGMSLKAPNENHSDWMVTIRAKVNGELVVAFCSGFKLAEVMDKSICQFAAGTLKWKVDDYGK